MKGERTNLRNLILYEVYVRNHGPNGTFDDVTNDLPRIKSLGIDVIWLMPIHPIGQLNKKGTLGCPYSIRDYRKVNPEYGTLADFQKLIETAHNLDLKVIIDVVYNHTSHDSVLVTDHPEFFHKDSNGSPVSTVPEWSDVIDLKYPNPDLEEYLIDTLCYWVKMGVDGFRCDVASIIPMDFWEKAKLAVEAINPDVIWLAESVHTAWVAQRREQGLVAHSDSELYSVFDITYEYDIWPMFIAAIQHRMPVMNYLEMLHFQKGIYPKDFIKMRCVENHDNPRIMAVTPTEVSAKAWAAFQIFNQGAFLMYAGQESGVSHTPSLFDVDMINWGDYSLSSWYKRLFELKKNRLFVYGHQHFLADAPSIQMIWRSDDSCLLAIFNINDISEPIHCEIPDGLYNDLLSTQEFQVDNQHILMDQVPAVVFNIPLETCPDYLNSTWLGLM